MQKTDTERQDRKPVFMDSSGQVTVYVLSVKHPQDIFYDVPSHASSLTAQSHIDAADGFPAGALIPILTGSQLWSCSFFPSEDKWNWGGKFYVLHIKTIMCFGGNSLSQSYNGRRPALTEKSQRTTTA